MYTTNYLWNMYSRVSTSIRLKKYIDVEELKETHDKLEHLYEFFKHEWEEAADEINLESIISSNEFEKIPNHFSPSCKKTTFDPYVFLQKMKILVKKQAKVPFRYDQHHYPTFVSKIMENFQRIKDYQRNLKRFHVGYDMKVYDIETFPLGFHDYVSRLVNVIASRYPEKVKEYAAAIDFTSSDINEVFNDTLSLLKPERKLWEELVVVVNNQFEMKPRKRLVDGSKRKLYVYHKRMREGMNELWRIKMHQIHLIQILLIQKKKYPSLIARSSLSDVMKMKRKDEFMRNIKIRIRRALLIFEVIQAFQDNFKFPMDYNVIKYDQ